MDLDYQTLALIGFGIVILVLLVVLFWRQRHRSTQIQTPSGFYPNPNEPQGSSIGATPANHAITALADVSHHLADLLHKSSPTGTTSPQKEVGKPE